MSSARHIGAAGLCLALSVASNVNAQSGTKPSAPEPSSETKHAPERAERNAVHASAEEAVPLKAGETLPSVASLKSVKGETVSLADATKGGPAVIVFYRGGWCPFCNTQLAGLAKAQPELASRGVRLIAISPDKPEELAKSLEKDQLPYTLLSDSDHKAMKAFGIAFAVDAPTQEKYKGYGIDLAKASGNPEAVLPVPSVFVVDERGTVQFAYSNPDYKVRLGEAELLKAVASVAPKAASSGTKEEASSKPEGSGSK